MADFVHVDRLSLEEQDVVEDSEPSQPGTEEREQPEESAEPKELSKKQPAESPTESDLKFLGLHPFVRQTVLDKISGCIFGSALGDTIGLYTEFLPKYACELVYKHRKFSLVEPVTEPYPDHHRSMSITLQHYLSKSLNYFSILFFLHEKHS